MSVRRRQVYLALLVVWVAFTFLLTSIPNPQVEIPIPQWDKIAHFSFYGVMGLLCALWQRESGRGSRASILAGLVFASVAGGIDEGHQHFIPGRSMELIDWIADTAGGGTGALFSAFLPKLLPFLLTE
jgi:VanZ family protein